MRHLTKPITHMVFAMTLIVIALSSCSPKSPQRIAFVSGRDGNQEIYVMNADGGDQTRLTHIPGSDFSPAWSPDGTQIAFVSGVDAVTIRMLNVETARQGNIAEPAGIVDFALYIDFVWSPDGEQLAFTHHGNGRVMYLYVVNADGSALDDLNIESYSSQPAWSPDSKRIAFVSNLDGNSEIYVTDASEFRRKTGLAQLTNLTRHPTNDCCPVWSPDGAHIAYASNRDGNSEVYLMKPDGSDPIQLTNSLSDSGNPVWSPDSSRILYLSGDAGAYEIFIMNADGSNPINLTNHSANDWFPTWSPDGARIAFVSDRDGNWEIYVINADGSGLTNLTNNPAHDFEPAWQP